ncbi:MAG: hypothetical protein P8Z00_19950 [Anaerolineales bacterium]
MGAEGVYPKKFARVDVALIKVYPGGSTLTGVDRGPRMPAAKVQPAAKGGYRTPEQPAAKVHLNTRAASG